jgi:plastocyanin
MTGRMRIIVVTVGAVLALVLAILPIVGAAEPREIIITAREMAFYTPGLAEENPTIHVVPGERVRLTLVNEDEGFDHDLVVSDWKTGIDAIRGRGRASIVLQAPDQPGRTTYICTLHSSMMKGTIEVSARPVSGTQH